MIDNPFLRTFEETQKEFEELQRKFEKALGHIFAGKIKANFFWIYGGKLKKK